MNKKLILSLLVFFSCLQFSFSQIKDTLHLKVDQHILKIAAKMAAWDEFKHPENDMCWKCLERLMRFDSIKDLSSENELLELIKYPNSQIKCYAFLGLMQIGSSKIINALPLLYNDTSTVYDTWLGWHTKFRVVDFIYYSTNHSNLKITKIALSKQQKKELRLFRKLMLFYVDKKNVEIRENVDLLMRPEETTTD